MKTSIDKFFSRSTARVTGKWIIVEPTDCFTAVPVYQCSRCKKLTSGYEPDSVCVYCGSINKVANHEFVALALFEDTEDELK